MPASSLTAASSCTAPQSGGPGRAVSRALRVPGSQEVVVTPAESDAPPRGLT